MCNRNFSRKHAKEAEGMLSWETFEKLRPWFRYARTVLFSGFGEPFLHPQYTQMLKIIKERVPFVFAYTNGILMGEDLAKSLVENGMDRICVSIGGATRDTYKYVRGVDAFEQVVNNLRFLKDYKHKTKRIKPEVHFEVVAMNSILPELEALVRLAHELDVVRIGMPNLVAQDIEMRRESPWENVDRAKQSFQGAAALAKRLNVQLNYPDLEPASTKDCRIIFNSMSVNWDGTVMVCARERYIVGSVHERSLNEIWNSSGMIGLRRKYHREGIQSICPSCTFWDNRPENYLNPPSNSREFAERLAS
jgi:radical SAM protein with 4Fe4S-binding SPASM domain